MTFHFCFRQLRCWLSAAAVLGLSACAVRMPPPPGPLVYERSDAVASALGDVAPEQRPTRLQVDTLPSQPPPQGSTPAPTAQVTAPQGSDEPVSIAIEQTPLPIFIQVLYGNVLKQPYSMDAAVQTRTDLVTFKTSRPLSPSRLQQVAVTLLRSYGLAVLDLDGLIRIVPADAASQATGTQLRRGRTLPDTPESLRTAFQHVELEVVRSTEALQWLRQILGQRLSATDDPQRNGLLLSGTQTELRTALDLLQALDQPRMRGRVARRISPAFASATEFSQRLVEVLTAQGYAASSTQSSSVPILVLPIPAINSLVVFTTSESVMDHVLQWATELDRPPAGSTTNALFTYTAQYADAQELAKTLGELLGGGSAAPQQGAAGGAAPRSSGGGRVVVNNATNTLIFRGSSTDEYQQIQSLMRELDRPTKSALVEVLVAEIRRDALESFGVSWDFDRFGLAAAVGTASIGGSGLATAFTSDSRRIRSTINALASSNRARVLSNPKIMARNGETATIQVGQEVPIITSQQTTGGSTSTGIFGPSVPNVLQTVQYRSTGVILKVRPIIYSGNRLDLEVQQEVSSAARTETGVASSPTIATRRVETKLSLRDGSTVLLAGLISRNNGDGNAGVPFLKDIPGLGALFGNRSTDNSETELLVMITPYIINDDFEAESISDAVQASFGSWARDISPSRIDRTALPTAPTIDPMAPAGYMGTGVTPTTPKRMDRIPQLPTPIAPRQMAPTTTEPAASQPVTPTTAADEAGVITSTPASQPAAVKAPHGAPPAASGGPRTPAQAAPAASAPTAAAGKPPPIKGGVTVEDEEAKAQIRRLLEKR